MLSFILSEVCEVTINKTVQDILGQCTPMNIPHKVGTYSIMTFTMRFSFVDTIYIKYKEATKDCSMNDSMMVKVANDDTHYWSWNGIGVTFILNSAHKTISKLVQIRRKQMFQTQSYHFGQCEIVISRTTKHLVYKDFRLLPAAPSNGHFAISYDDGRLLHYLLTYKNKDLHIFSDMTWNKAFHMCRSLLNSTLVTFDNQKTMLDWSKRFQHIFWSNPHNIPILLFYGIRKYDDKV